MKAHEQEWKTVIDLGRRLGRVSESASTEALERLQETPDPGSDLVAAWLSLPPSETEALCALARAMLGAHGDSPPPAGVTPTPTSDVPTMKLEDVVTVKSPPPATPTPPAPKRLGPYELLEELGHGGMGVVYKARHTRLGSLCAVKVLLAGEFASTEAVARFQREAAAVAKMGRHPNLVAVHDLGQEGGVLFYAMELVEGRSLRARMREGDVPVEEACLLVEKVARAVHFAHGHGVIHRDLKPENIMIRGDASREPQVMDFGLAREAGSEERLSVAGQIMGTLAYMAPEQARGDVDAIDARTDVYALGGVLYDLLTRMPPHPGRTPAVMLPAILRGEIIPPRKLRPEVPRDLENVCLKALALEPHRRYESAEALADDLARYRSGESVTARPVGRLVRFARLVRRRPLVSGLLSASVLLGIVLLWRLAGPARLSVATTPDGAAVEVVGRTLWRGWVWPAGECRLRVSAPGHDAKDLRVDLAPGSSRDLGTIALDVDHGSLTVASDPPGARVIVDERDMEARTPVQGLRVPNGQHVLHLHADDHSDHIASILIEPGKDRDLGSVRLAHKKGTLTVGGAPVGMAIHVLNASTRAEVTRLSPPASVPFDTGRYLLSGRMNGCFDQEVPIVVEEGKEATAFLPLVDQVLWKIDVGGKMDCPPLLGDVDDDGLLDCVVVSQGTAIAIGGRDGQQLWRREDQVTWGPGGAFPDIDGDGTRDVALSARSYIQTLSGRDGSFLWWSRPGGTLPGGIAAADLDADGVLDYLAPSSDGHVYAVSGATWDNLWGSVEVGVSTRPPEVADLTGDGVPDAVIAIEKGKVAALSGRDGAVLWVREFKASFQCSPALGDVNGDGGIDCVIGTEKGTLLAFSGRTGETLWSRRAGGQIDAAAAIADLDGDGEVEVVAATWSYLSAFRGKDGTPLWSVDTPGIVDWAVRLGDLDGDGTLDCVVPSRKGVVIAHSGRDGRRLWSFSAGRDTTFVTLGDVNGDGILDCVISGEAGWVYAVAGTGGSHVWGGAQTDGLSAHPGVGDLDADGLPDVVTWRSRDGLCARRGTDGRVLWRRTPIGQTHTSLLVADLDGDGRGDVLACSGPHVFAFACRVPGTLWAEHEGSPALLGTAAADLDGDGVADVVLGAEDGHVQARSGKDGHPLWRRDLDAGRTDQPVVLTLGGDPIADVLVPTRSLRLFALSGRTGGTLWEVGLPKRFSDLVAGADLDGDGVPDCVVSSDEEMLLALSGRDGRRIWTTHAPPWVLRPPTLGDLDLDGTADLVLTDLDDRVHALDGRTGEVWWSREFQAVGGASAAIGDVDGDGSTEVVVGGDSGTVLILCGVDGAVRWSFNAPERGSVSDPILVDVDRDGALEILSCCEGGGTEAMCSGLDLFRAPRLAVPTPLAPERALARARSARQWRRLGRLAEGALAPDSGREVQAEAQAALGLSRAWARDARGAAEALAKARELGLSTPEVAVYAWIAERARADGDASSRAATDKALGEAIRRHPHVVFDLLVETRPIVGEREAAALAELLAGLAKEEETRRWVVLLSSIPSADGQRPYRPSSAGSDDLAAAREELASRLLDAADWMARGVGYLLILAEAEGNEAESKRTREAWLQAECRPASIETLMEEAARRRARK